MSFKSAMKMALRGDAQVGQSTEQGCRELLRLAAAQAGLMRHTELVACAAGALARLCRADQTACVSGALLHDIGRAQGAAALAAGLGAGAVQALGALDHPQLGAAIARAAGEPYASLASAVGRHALHSVLGGSPPQSIVEKVVFLADKLVGQGWLGFRGRIRDLEQRYGHLYDIRLCVPGAEVILLGLAGRACLSAVSLERLVAEEMPRGLTRYP